MPIENKLQCSVNQSVKLSGTCRVAPDIFQGPFLYKHFGKISTINLQIKLCHPGAISKGLSNNFGYCLLPLLTSETQCAILHIPGEENPDRVLRVIQTEVKARMNWIRKEKRIAIYNRDGNICLYCGSNNNLSLDHIIPRSKGGSNDTSNLITCCIACNSSRQEMDINVHISTYSNPKAIRDRITNSLSKRIKQKGLK